MTSEQMNFRCPVSLKKAIEQQAKRLNLTQTELVIKLLEQGLEGLTGSPALASHTPANPSQPALDVRDSQIAAHLERLTTDSQASLDRLDSVEEAYLADKLAINQRIDSLLKTLTSLARQQKLLNSHPCHQPELDKHLAKIDSYVSSYAALQARVDELSDNFAQVERIGVTLSQQNGENLAQSNSSLQEQIFQLLMEVETLKGAIAQSALYSKPIVQSIPPCDATASGAIAPRGQREAISSATASGAIASQESLPLSPDRSEPTDCIEPALIGEHSLLSVTSSPTEPSPNVSESPGDWLTLSEAHKIAQANGYEGSKDSFRMLPSYQQDYNQIYGQYGLKADLERRSQRGKPSRYFCRHSLS
jgi:hypothetical protein